MYPRTAIESQINNKKGEKIAATTYFPATMLLRRRHSIWYSGNDAHLVNCPADWAVPN